MNNQIEKRYKVDDGYDFPFIQDISGIRRGKTVKVPRIRALSHSAIIGVESWDLLPRSVAAAQIDWIAKLEKNVEFAKSKLEQATKDLEQARLRIDHLTIRPAR